MPRAATRLSYFAPWSSRSYHARLRAARKASGVYLIRDAETHRALYVGESHSGQLYDTVTRHFREWSGPTQGYTVDRHRVEVAIQTCVPSEARALQAKWIARFDPYWNKNDRPDDSGSAPF